MARAICSLSPRNSPLAGRPSRAEITDAAMSHRAECVMLNKGPYVMGAFYCWTTPAQDAWSSGEEASCFESFIWCRDSGTRWRHRFRSILTSERRRRALADAFLPTAAGDLPSAMTTHRARQLGSDGPRVFPLGPRLHGHVRLLRPGGRVGERRHDSRGARRGRHPARHGRLLRCRTQRVADRPSIARSTRQGGALVKFGALRGPDGSWIGVDTRPVP